MCSIYIVVYMLYCINDIARECIEHDNPLPLPCAADPSFDHGEWMAVYKLLALCFRRKN